jgi:predicted ATPase
MWDQQPQLMSTLLIDHNLILEQAITSHKGKVFKTVGDGFCAVFESASDALAASLDAQRRLYHQPSQSVKLKVRMGLHCGPAEERDNDYFGPTLNRVARLMGVASGGQTLISQAVKEHCMGQLPYGVELRDLGLHKLKDLKEAEHIFQIVAPDLLNSFPPIKSLSPRISNLPAQLTSFIGREQDVEHVIRLMRSPQVRLLTLLGSGGTGKTRLSIEIGAHLQEEYEDGTFFIALAPIRRIEDVIEVIAQALKVEEVGDMPLLESIKMHVQSRHMLLILDNFEQVIDAAPLVNDLLSAGSHLKALVTSREELMIYGERVYHVTPLGMPEPGQLIHPDVLLKFSAIKLFAERVQSAQPDFTVDTTNAPSIIEICRRLDGLPLAIELAAVRARDLSIEAIAEQLSNRLQILSKGPRDFPSRQRTMRGAIEWSYEMLPVEEQQAFAQLGVFVGPFSAEAADTVTGAQCLNRLKEKSLVHQVEDNEYTITFVMLETLREYALEQLEAQAEIEALKRCHANYYLQLTETAEPHLTSDRQVEWFGRLENETHNIEAALEWLLSRQEIERAGQMAGVLWRFWGGHSHLSAGSHWIEQILMSSNHLSPLVYAKVTHGAGRLSLLQYRYREASQYLKLSLMLYERSGNQPGQAAIYLSLGEIELRQANSLPAQNYFEKSLEFYLLIGDQAGRARCLCQLGRLAVHRKDLAKAQTLFEQSLDLLRQYGSSESLAMVLNDLAEVLRAQGEYEAAATLYHESLNLYRLLDFNIGVAVILHNLGQVMRRLGNDGDALRFFQEALSLLQSLEEKQIIVECLAAIGGIFVSQNQLERAVHFLGAANALMRAVDIQLDLADQIEYERNLETAQKQLHESVWNALWSDGQSMPLEKIIMSALQLSNL